MRANLPIGACAVALEPLVQALRDHVLRAERLHSDDTKVPVLAKMKTVTGRLWTYVRDDRPFGGKDPPAAFFEYSRNRAGEHPQRHLAGYAGIMQADAYQGYGKLYELDRMPAPIMEAGCWAHWRRDFFDLAKDGKSPIAAEAVRRMNELFEIERAIYGKSPAERVATRREQSKPLVEALDVWLHAQRLRVSAKNDLAIAINYGLSRWPAFTRFLDDGCVCLSNNAAERAVRGIAVGRRNWTFAGSDEGGRRAAAMYTLIESCKLNDVDPQAWLADILARLPDHPAKRIGELLPWTWKSTRQVMADAVAA
jgi:transposase